VVQIYMAAVYTNSLFPGQRHDDKLTEREREIVKALPNVLESYHYVGKQQYIDAMRSNGAKVFLDSGAFSAHTLGVQMDLPAYCRYVQDNADIIRVEDGALMASVLDGIGDPLQTYRNQLEMEALGVRPLPCFHFGEDERYLEHYVANYSYITIGGMVGKTVPQLLTWLDRVWNKYMVDGAGRPKTKVHAFGITSIPVMEAYPWYSCDSSSWVQSANFGGVILPGFGPIKVSDKSPSRHDFGQHASTLSEPEQRYVFDRLEANGFNYDRVSTVYESRWAWNLWAFGEINKGINAEKGAKYRTKHQELF
jgi:hypothetical protein